jgi:hypothetical protein
MPEINLKEITLEDLVTIIGGFIHRGGVIEDVELELIMRLQELVDDEIEYRIRGVPKGEVIH